MSIVVGMQSVLGESAARARAFRALGLITALVACAGCGGSTSGSLAISVPSVLQTSEMGDSITIMVVLRSQPSFPVSVPVESSDETEGRVSPSVLTFTPDNWDAPQAVTVRGANDALEDGSQTYIVRFGPSTSMDAGFINLSAETASITNTDDETAGISVSAVNGGTTENGTTATFSVRLRSQPSATVTLTLESDDTSEGTPSPAVLTFTTANWNAPHLVTVTGANDDLADGNIEYTISSASIASSDDRYAALATGVLATLSNTDNDTAGITVTPTLPMRTTESGGTATLTVTLNAQPSSNVTIGVTSSDVTEGTVSDSMLTFTSVDWASPKTVTVTGVDDALMDNNQPYMVVFAPASSSDPAYTGETTPSVGVTNIDNDTPGFIVSAISGNTTESGGTATFTVELTSPPTQPVSITVSSSNTMEGTIVGSPTLMFTAGMAGNWNVPQTVTVQGVNDASPIVDGNQLYNITFTTPSSTDAGYAALPAPNPVVVTNTDNDSPGFVISAASVSVREDGPSVVTFNVTLQVATSMNVTVAVSSSDILRATVSPSSLVFTSGDWNMNHVVTVTAANDLLDDGDVPFSIVFGAAVSPGTAYDGLMPAAVPGTSVDNETTLIVRHSLRCMDFFEADSNPSTADSEVIQRDCDGTARQVWEVRSVAAGVYNISPTVQATKCAVVPAFTTGGNDTDPNRFNFHRVTNTPGACGGLDRTKWRFVATTTAPWFQIQTLEGSAAVDQAMACRCMNVGGQALTGDYSLADFNANSVINHIIRQPCSLTNTPANHQAWQHNLSYTP